MYMAFPSFFWILSFDFARLPSIALLDGTAWKESPRKHHHHWHDTETQTGGHGAKSWALHGFKYSIWYILQLKTGHVGRCHFLVCLEFPVNPLPTEPLSIFSFSACPPAGHVQLLRSSEPWVACSAGCAYQMLGASDPLYLFNTAGNSHKVTNFLSWSYFADSSPHTSCDR